MNQSGDGGVHCDRGFTSEMNAISFLFQTSLICGINLLKGVCGQSCRELILHRHWEMQ
jgi:hypothetical protein